ncbi:unnamed protein product [Rhizoctonia solani]|uniref:Uncharacterized protein n=1 Tax=Rhizoctonia solani TaxID=456999 RepID=A0A8H3HTL7_9AGAM|nr:unnamed protein product [Rhizoctonia solani]
MYLVSSISNQVFAVDYGSGARRGGSRVLPGPTSRATTTTTRLVSSFSSSSNSHSATIMESKDRRTMYAARQHTLHSSDRRKSKSVWAPKSQGGSRPGSQFSSIDDSDDHVDYATHPDRLHDEWDCPCCTAEANARAIPAPRNVSLAEVIQIKSGRKKKGPEGDFEMVPRPGEVLVLDEDQDELYAGWEDVSMGALRDASNVARLPVSYAAALSRR